MEDDAGRTTRRRKEDTETRSAFPLRVSASPRRPPPPYIDLALRDAVAGDCEQLTFVHLGHWDAPPREKPSAGEFPVAQLRLTEALLAMADVGDGMTVLDVACGFGGTLALLNARYHDMTLVGLDRDPRQLQVARRIAVRQGNRLAWNCGDACELPYPNKSFARVLCIEAMFHFASRRAFLAEAARVLCPGGRLICSDIVACRGKTRRHGDARGGISASSLPASPSAIQTIIENGMGPWPDLWGVDADHDALAASAGLSLRQTVDATAATLPSHACILSGPPSPRLPTQPVRLASAMLAWLHRHGYVRVLYKSYQAN